MLDQVEIFHGLSREELAALEDSSSSENYPKNTVVIQENERRRIVCHRVGSSESLLQR